MNKHSSLRLRMVIAISGLSLSGAASAYDWHAEGVLINMVESTYMPTMITLKINSAAGPCAANTLIEYRPRGNDDQAKRDNIKATYALLLAAKLSGHKVNLYGANTSPDAGICLVEYVQVN